MKTPTTGPQTMKTTRKQILSATPDDLAGGAPLPQKMQGLRVGVFMQIQQSAWVHLE